MLEHSVKYYQLDQNELDYIVKKQILADLACAKKVLKKSVNVIFF